MTVLSARNLTKSFGTQVLLSGVSLTISDRERIGVLGQNGTGKSTLLRILAGLEAPDDGVIDRRRGSRVLYLSQEPRFPEHATPRELVLESLSEWKVAVRRYEALSAIIEQGDAAPGVLAEQASVGETIERLGGWTREHLAEQMLERLGVLAPDQPIGTMSGGEQRRVALAQVLVAAPDLAILDEPTNHLDADTIEWLEEYLVESFGGAVLLVTHDRYVLDAICERVCELERGALSEYRGNYADYLEQKAEREAHAERVESNRLNLLRRERAWLLRGAKARTTKQKARVDRAKTLLETQAPETVVGPSLGEFANAAARTGKTIVDATDVSLELGGKRLIDKLTLRMVPGDRLGIIGKNGMGKTSLLRLVTGELSATSGELVIGQRTQIALFDQTRSILNDDWSVFDNVADREGADRTGAGVIRVGERTYELRSYLEQFSFRGIKQRQKAGALSGGERARLALAKVLSSSANLLLLDEPTNDLDIQTLGSMEELLEGWAGSALIVSHDRYFLDRVATSLLVFEGDGRVVQYPGGYASYRSLREQAEAQEAAARGARRAEPAEISKSTPPKAQSTREARAKKALTYAERLELDGLLDRVTTAESSLQELEAELAKPGNYADAEAAKQRRQDYERARTLVSELTARWEELEARR